MNASQTTSAQRVTVVYTADQIYQETELRDLWMGESDAGIHLFYGEVVENDGSGAGRSDEEGIEPFIAVDGRTVLRKVLRLDEPRVQKAMLAFVAREHEDHDASLRFTVNGREVLRPPSLQAAPEARQYWEPIVGEWSWSRWYYVEIPGDTLQAGDNEITVQAVDGRSGWELMVADYRDFYKGTEDPVVLPHASQRSEDGGQSWKEERGEYVLRLALRRYRRKGKLISPVLDAAGEGGVKERRAVQNLRLDWEVETPEGTGIGFQVRTGSHPAFDAEQGSDWQSYQPGEVFEPRGRYLQWKAELMSGEPDRSPVLKSVQVDAEVLEEEPAPELRIVRADNARILRSSFEMAPEDYDCDLLRELRERCELDAVVAGAKTEFEQIERLLEWAYYVPLKDCRHFPWNVLDWIVLERDEKGTLRMNQYQQRRRDAMCLYPNVVLAAACLSMGIPARHVNFHSEGMTGHEIAEAWSNDYGKWVHLDATRDYYWYDPKTLVPLDTLEIHQVLVERLEEVERWDRPYLFYQDLEELVRDLPIAFREGRHEFSVEEGALFLFRSFCHFRVVPRFKVFSQARPLPVSQGTEVWAWNGYLNWADDKVPPLLHFSYHTNRRADFYPTLNQTRYTVERSENPYELQVHLETNMSQFARFQAKADRSGWEERPADFAWTLHEGLNVLQVRAWNQAGVEGIVSSLSVEV